MPYLVYGVGAGIFAIYTWYFSDADPKAETHKTIRLVAIAAILLVLFFFLRNRRAAAPTS